MKSSRPALQLRCSVVKRLWYFEFAKSAALLLHVLMQRPTDIMTDSLNYAAFNSEFIPILSCVGRM